MYGFKGQCMKYFGDANGTKVWWIINRVFDDFPLAALLDGKMFCAHGGIPRLGPSGKDDRLEILENQSFWTKFRDASNQAELLEVWTGDVTSVDPSSGLSPWLWLLNEIEAEALELTSVPVDVDVAGLAVTANVDVGRAVAVDMMLRMCLQRFGTVAVNVVVFCLSLWMWMWL